MKRTHAFLFVLSLSALAGCSGGGGGVTPPATADYFDEMRPSLRWSRAKTDNPLKVSIGLDGTTDRSATVMAALNNWTTGTSNLVRFEKVSAGTGEDITIQFATTIPNRDTGLGDTQITFNDTPGNPTVDGTITKVDILLKTNQPNNILIPLVEHEVGHGLGLVARRAGDASHSTYSGDVMFGSVGSSSGLSTRDTGTLVKLYALSRKR